MSISLERYSEGSTLEKAIDFDPHNHRIKVYQIPEKDQLTDVVHQLEKVGKEEDCDKIIFYAQHHEVERLQATECELEGKIDGFFQGEDAYIYSVFLNSSRNQPFDWKQEQKVMEIVQQDQQVLNLKTLNHQLPENYSMRSAGEHDAPKMAKLYDTVFETYPTPMDDPDFIIEMMNQDVYFTVVEHDEKVVSACSADVFPQFNSAEMTDCATLPEYRGKRLLSHQFQHLENKMEDLGVQTLFSYSRALSVGMNLINARHGYTYGGRMIQNSNIAGRLEDMNIWVKCLNK